MGWLKAAAGWGLAGAVLGLILVNLEHTSDPEWFVVMLTVMIGLFGLFFHYRDRKDAQEDRALEAAALDPASAEAAREWITRLKGGGRIKVGMFATLTSEGVEWTGLRKASVRWGEVERVAPWTMTVKGTIRASRMVRVRANGKTLMINCSKRNFPDVLATCVEMARAAA